MENTEYCRLGREMESMGLVGREEGFYDVKPT